ncbi:MAG: hypothetical protein WB729_11615 [Candidatus Sulfotelmatobacter sp.]
MRNRAGLYVGESTAPVRYQQVHTKNSWALVMGQLMYVRDCINHLRYRQGLGKF